MKSGRVTPADVTRVYRIIMLCPFETKLVGSAVQLDLESMGPNLQRLERVSQSTESSCLLSPKILLREGEALVLTLRMQNNLGLEYSLT